MPEILMAAFALGLVYNAAPGPVLAETVHRSVAGGFRAGLAVQFGSLAGDALWAALGLAGVGFLFRSEALRGPAALIGAGYLLWLALDAWRRAGSTGPATVCRERDDGSEALRSGIILSLTNPQAVAFWAAVGSAFGAIGAAEPTAADYGFFYAGFLLSSVLWALAAAALVDRLLGWLGTGWARVSYRLCALAFLLLGLASLRTVLPVP
ncbi:MAG: LysE family transporter [Gammaproteobacteria bacterium]|nr:LysE family transporter [Gammaproteobacteria bacterium]